MMALWIALASGLLVLLAAAIKKKDSKSCRGVEIDIAGVKGDYCFLDKKDVLGLLGADGEGQLSGRNVSTFNLRQLEMSLEKNVWVKDAELFFDNNLVLHIAIEERAPIARVFTVAGNSFYIDSSGKKLPLSDRMKVRLPVFTNYTAESTSGIGKKGTKLVNDMRKLAYYILNDPFWNAQVAQIDIVGDGNFELVPMLGNHIIEFGNGDNCGEKFRRLFIFYKEVLGKTGFDKYSRVDVRYDKQVVGTRRGSISRVDSMQAIRNIEKLMMAAMVPKPDTNQLNNN